MRYWKSCPPEHIGVNQLVRAFLKPKDGSSWDEADEREQMESTREDNERAARMLAATMGGTGAQSASVNGGASLPTTRLEEMPEAMRKGLLATLGMRK